MEQVLGKKAKTRKGKKVLNALESQLHEGIRNCAFMRGNKCSQSVQTILKILYLFKKKSGVNFNKKKNFRPMDDQDKLKAICFKQRCPFFCFG